MSKIKEAIVEAILPVIKSAGIIELEAVLTAIKDHNKKEVYQETLQALYVNFSLLKEAAVQTKSGIDDGIIDLVLQAVTGTAKQDQILLINDNYSHVHV